MKYTWQKCLLCWCVFMKYLQTDGGLLIVYYWHYRYERQQQHLICHSDIAPGICFIQRWNDGITKRNDGITKRNDGITKRMDDAIAKRNDGIFHQGISQIKLNDSSFNKWLENVWMCFYGNNNKRKLFKRLLCVGYK